MKLGILSDLHLEFDRSYPAWDFEPEPDVFYICAGDIHSNHYERFAFISRHEDHMFHVLGNHDYYGREFPHEGLGKTFEKDGVKFAGATLWTDLSDPQDWYNYVNGLVDSRYINGLSYDAYNERFQEHLDFLLNSEADVIVTHHCPTLKAIAPQFQTGDSVKYNPGFASDLEQKILDMKKPPKLWVYGHTHWRHSYTIGETFFVCNPRGYPRENGYYSTYKPEVIEL